MQESQWESCVDWKDEDYRVGAVHLRDLQPGREDGGKAARHKDTLTNPSLKPFA